MLGVDMTGTLRGVLHIIFITPIFPPNELWNPFFSSAFHLRHSCTAFLSLSVCEEVFEGCG